MGRLSMLRRSVALEALIGNRARCILHERYEGFLARNKHMLAQTSSPFRSWEGKAYVLLSQAESPWLFQLDIFRLHVFLMHAG